LYILQNGLLALIELHDFSKYSKKYIAPKAICTIARHIYIFKAQHFKTIQKCTITSNLNCFLPDRLCPEYKQAVLHKIFVYNVPINIQIYPAAKHEKFDELQ